MVRDGSVTHPPDSLGQTGSAPVSVRLTKQITIGIDPGVTGAVAVLLSQADGAGLPVAPDVEFFDTPTVKVNIGTKSRPKNRTEYEPGQMAEILQPYRGIAAVAIEKARPLHLGIIANASLNQGYGIWLGLVAAFGMPYQVIRAVDWQADMLRGLSKGKGSALSVAHRLFPQARDGLGLRLKAGKITGTDGRADALLIAEWRRRQG